MSDWKEYKLGDIAYLRSEKFTPNKHTVYPYIGLEHIEQKSLRLNGIGSSNDVSSQKSIFYPDDILYGKLRPYFQKVYSPKFKGVCSTDIFVIRAKNDIDSKFLFYLLASDEFTNIANLGSTGTRMPRADWKHLSMTFWNVPDVITQKSIGEILSSLDDKIELNNKINQELESLAQLLFKRWFVDFEFPNEKGEPYKSSGGEMVDSELGEIPKGWEVKPIGELFEMVIGGDWGMDIEDNEHTELNYVIRGTDIPSLLKGTINTIPFRAIKPSKLKNRQIQINDIIIEISGGSKDQPTGRTILITKEILERLNNKAIPASFCRLIRPKQNFAEFLGIYLTKIYLEGKTWEYQNQSTGISNFQFKYFESAELLALPIDFSVINKFNNLINGFYNLMTTNENLFLTKTRDYLLPKLISGELQINEN